MRGPTRAGQYLRGGRDVRRLTAAAGAAGAGARSSGSFLDDLAATWRMIRAYVRGDYRDVRLRSVLAFVTGALYFLSPIDLIPDVFLLLGLTDDAVVVSLVFTVLRRELAGFRAWERSQVARVVEVAGGRSDR
jgi:uncharacterized membrane protein YkvA (DUF1232 family)